jgi:hypothetical protein
MNPHRLLSWALIIAVVCGLAVINPAPVIGVTPVQMCTAQNVAGFPYSGSVCGGSVIDGCGPGAIYKCTGGARNTTNNCLLDQACAVGCLTGTNSTPVTLNTATPRANDACFTGAAPLTFSTNTTTGGNDVTLTATLQAAHSPYAIVNLEGTGPLVPPLCNPPLFLMANTTTVSVVEPTGVVNTPTTVPLWVLISYTDAATGRGRNLVSVPSSLTLNPRDTPVVPPSLLSFSLTDGAGTAISTIPGGSSVFTHGTLSAPALVGGTKVTVTSNPASAFVSDGSFVIDAGCTTNSTAGVLTATSPSSNLAATVSATTGAGGTLTQNVVVTPPQLNIQSITLTPATVTGGSSLTATVTLNRAVLSSDASSAVSVRVSEGTPSGAQVATFAGCTGTPACSGPLTVPVGASSASLTTSTSAVNAQQFVTVSASATWSNASASAQLTINPGGATAPALSSLVMSPSSGTCGFSSSGTVTLTGAAPAGGAAVTLSSSSVSNAQVPTSVTVAPGQTQATFTATTGPTCSLSSVVITATYGGVSKQNALFFNTATCSPTTCQAQGTNCGTISDGCGGTLTCGTCTAPQTCCGGGVANVCGGGTTASTAQLTLSATGRSGESVSSSPVGLTVNVGTTGSASFATSTLVTLTVSNGRDAIWSGGCSSGGAKQKSCSLTLNAAASVTANVQ